MAPRGRHKRFKDNGKVPNSRGRRVFTKLVKDESATMDNKNSVFLFIDGMDSYESKAELLAVLDDNRNCGGKRLKQALSMIGSVEDVNTILVPILLNVINPENGRPLYKMLRNRILTIIYSVPGLIMSLIDFVSLEQNSMKSLQIICSFLEASAMILVDARGSEDMKAIAKILRKKDGVDGSRLCALLLIDKVNEKNNKLPPVSSTNDNTRSTTACWVTDSIPPGGRHDNDHTNFRDIELIPTHQEIVSETSPWLPLASGANAIIKDETARMLDSNFRLLREDAVSTFRNNISERRNEWQHSRIVDVCCTNGSKAKGATLSFVVQLDPRSSTKINWGKSRLLPFGGVVAFCRDGVPMKMATISIRDFEQPGQWLHSPEGPQIGVIFQREQDFLSSLEEVSSNIPLVTRAIEMKKRIKGKGSGKRELEKELQAIKAEYSSYTLIEASSSFFSYIPVLNALKDMQTIPLNNELVFFNHSKPSYLPTNVTMPQDEKFFKGYVCDIDNWSTEAIVNATSLNDSQANALRNALTSKVSLIQGPPGTGKSFIGALVAQMIRENTEESILCVCYTNHALDQFLEHLLDNGENEIVRIGGRSKSEKLKQYQLFNLARTKERLSSVATRRLGGVIAQIHKSHERIQNLIEEMKEPISWNEPRGGICDHLQYNYPDFSNYFEIDHKLTDGFHIVGHNNKDIEPDFLWTEWALGKPCPEWIQVYMHLDPNLITFWSMSAASRMDRIKDWHNEILQDIRDELKDAVSTYDELTKEKTLIIREKDLNILKSARIIGATTSGAAQYKDILSAKSPGVVIVEEAGEVLEPHILASLSEDTLSSSETKHLILIGDHLQLRPKLENYRLSTVSGAGYNFDCSMFERLIKRNYPSSMLQVQHRMRPQISELIRQETYPTLKDHSSVFEFPSISGMSHDIVFVDHDQKEDGSKHAELELQMTTKSNNFEARYCIEFVRYLLLQGYAHEQITILTPYVGQVVKIAQSMKTLLKDTDTYISDLDMREIMGDDEINMNFSTKKSGVRCASVDNFQGEESDIIIISLVRSNAAGNIGFLKEPQRVNVLLSRARYGLYIVGNSKTLRRSKQGNHVWTPILNTLESRGQLLNGFPTVCKLHPDDGCVVITKPEDFRTLRPNGGCTRPCEYRMDCGHVCPQTCHPTDRNHVVAHKKCTEPCRRFPPGCKAKHPCRKFCKDECGPCATVVDPFSLPCGHKIAQPKCFEICSEEEKEKLSKRCPESVTHIFPKCGHTASVPCGVSTYLEPKCPWSCGKLLECGHLCTKKCGECGEQHSCGERCSRILICGHVCRRECHGSEECGPCQHSCEMKCHHSKCSKKCSSLCSPCLEDCDWQCEHEGKCPLVCGAPCIRLPCQKRCTKRMSCGHQCPSLCGEDCPPTEYCTICCKEDKKAHIVDMVSLESYEEHNVDGDPIIVLSCGHFYSTSTLDGLFGLSEAYDVDEYGDFVKPKPLLGNVESSKPKVCPDCRSPVHSVKRYGRLLSFFRLRFLEMKHLMSIDKSLQLCSQSTSMDYPRFDNVLGRIEKDIFNAPMKAVYEACGGESQVEVPPPPVRQTILLYQLKALSQSKRIESKDDEHYTKSIVRFKDAIRLCDESTSKRLGAEIRLQFAKALINWSSHEEVNLEVIELLDWIICCDISQNLGPTFTEANKLKSSYENKEVHVISEVVKAMNVVEGYNYGGAWSSHWYECPNGHPYFIGNCGGATTVSHCIECNAEVGGVGHQLLASNRSASGVVANVMNE